MYSYPSDRGARAYLIQTASLICLGLVLAVMAWLVWEIIVQGAPVISFDFLSQPVVDAGRQGGIAPILVSTGLLLITTLIVVVPLGLASAVSMYYLANSRQQKLYRLLRVSLDTLASTPSIVLGLFGNALFSVMLGLGFSILSGALTLACMVLPFFTRAAESALHAIPAQHLLQANALRLGIWSRFIHIQLPAAMPGLIVALILSKGRALAETAALIFTAGYVVRMPDSLLDSGRSLSVHILDLAMNVPGGNANAYGSALVLLTLLLFTNSFAHFLAKRFYKHAWSRP